MSFFTKTVDSIIADIKAKVEQLHVVAELHAKEVELHNAVVAERTKLAALAQAEHERAKAIAQNFLALIEFKKP